MVGVRGLIDSPHIYDLLEFLEIPGKYRELASEQTVVASVKVLYFMHQVQFGALYGRRKLRKVEADNHSNTSDSEATDDVELRTTLPKQ